MTTVLSRLNVDGKTVSVFGCTYWEALCDGDLDIKEEDSGSESSTDSNGLLGIAEHTAHAERNMLSVKKNS